MKVTLSPDRLINYNSQVLSGLYDLRAAGEIELSMTLEGFPRLTDGTRWESVVALRLDDAELGFSHKVVIDLIDGESVASPQHMEWADTYFKSGFRGTAPEFNKDKQRPFGLRYSCTSIEERVWDRLKFAYWSDRDQRGRVANRARWLKRLLLHPVYMQAARFKATSRLCRLPPMVPSFEYQPSLPATSTVFYRTRVYEVEKAGNSLAAAEFEKVNEMRSSTIRALKDGLGSSFIGGLRASPYAQARYPELVMSENWDHRQHLEAMRSSLIGVTTAGLFHSIDWKVAEYLAASRVTISQRFQQELPLQPADGREIIYFDTPAECLEQCKALLADPEKAQTIREAGHRFYHNHVKPQSVIRNCINEAKSRNFPGQAPVPSQSSPAWTSA